MVTPDSVSRTGTLRTVAETGFGYTLIVIAVWSPLWIRGYVALAAALWIGGSLLLSGAGLSGVGVAVSDFGLRALRRCSWAVVISLAAAAIMIALSAHLGALHFDSRLMTERPPLLGYLVWSLVQQIILQYFLLSRLLLLLRRPWAAVGVASLLFAAAHLPNPLLTLATLFWGATSCWLYLRTRSMIGVAAIHFVLGACLAICVPESMHRNMRVGLGYVRYKVPTTSSRANSLAPHSTGLATDAVHR